MPRKIAKLFNNGGSQAVRLPAEFRFDGDEVYVRRDAVTGDVILSKKSTNPWVQFLSLRDAAPVDPDFMITRPSNRPLHPRNPFADPA